MDNLEMDIPAKRIRTSSPPPPPPSAPVEGDDLDELERAVENLSSSTIVTTSETSSTTTSTSISTNKNGNQAQNEDQFDNMSLLDILMDDSEAPSKETKSSKEDKKDKANDKDDGSNTSSLLAPTTISEPPPSATEVDRGVTVTATAQSASKPTTVAPTATSPLKTSEDASETQKVPETPSVTDAESPTPAAAVESPGEMEIEMVASNAATVGSSSASGQVSPRSSSTDSIVPKHMTLDYLGGIFNNPFEIFPEELWGTVFHQLRNNPSDLQSISNSSQQWRSILEKERTSFLFPLVFDILVKNKILEFRDSTWDSPPPQDTSRPPQEPSPEANAEAENDDDPDAEEKAEQRSKYTSGYEPFKCRYVCKSWNAAIKSHIQLHPKHFHLTTLENEENWGNEGDDIYKGHQWQDGLYEFVNPDSITRFLEEFRDTHANESSDNPFLTKWVIFDDEKQIPPPCCFHGSRSMEMGYSRQYWSAITTILEKYGRHIFHLGISLGFNMTPLRFYEFLQQWLNLTPNVKVLHLKFNKYDFLKPTPCNGAHRVMNGATGMLRRMPPVVSPRIAQIRQLESTVLVERIASTPLIKLEDLQYLETYDLPEPLFNHLLLKNNHPRKLRVKVGHGSPMDYLQYFRGISMTDHLQEMLINLRDKADLEKLETSIVGGEGSWPLKTLHIFYRSPNLQRHDEPFTEEGELPEWSDLFKLIEEKFGETLEHLRIRLPKAGRHEDKRNILRGSYAMRLNLPKLKTIRVQIPNLSSVDFLLGAKDTLEEVTLTVAHWEWETIAQAEQKREKIKFNARFDKMNKSTIWKQLPKLKKLEVRVLDKADNRGPPECKVYRYKRPSN